MAQDLNFTYKIINKQSKPFNLVLYELTKVFEEHNFTRFSKQHAGQLPFVHADEVLYSNSDRRLIFISTKIIAPTEKQYKLLKGKEFILYHTEYASFAFFYFNSYQVSEITSSLISKSSLPFNPLNILINTATANSEVDCIKSTQNNLMAQDALVTLETLDKKIFNNLITQKVGECLMGAFKGMGDQINSTADFFLKLKDNPTQLWNEMKKTFTELHHLAVNFSNELQKTFNALSNLNTQDKLDIACHAAGQIAVSATSMLTGAGLAAGATKLLLDFLPKMQRLQRLLSQLNIYKIPATAVKDSLSCAI